MFVCEFQWVACWRARLKKICWSGINNPPGVPNYHDSVSRRGCLDVSLRQPEAPTGTTFPDLVFTKFFMGILTTKELNPTHLLHTPYCKSNAFAGNFPSIRIPRIHHRHRHHYSLRRNTKNRGKREWERVKPISLFQRLPPTNIQVET